MIMKYLGSRNMVGTNFNINFLRISHEYIPNSPLSFLLQLFHISSNSCSLLTHDISCLIMATHTHTHTLSLVLLMCMCRAYHLGLTTFLVAWWGKERFCLGNLSVYSSSSRGRPEISPVHISILTGFVFVKVLLRCLH